MVRSLSIITLSIIASMSLSLSVSAAPPPTPVGEFAGGTFAEYFRRVVNNPCPPNQYVIGFQTTPADYMKPICDDAYYIDAWNVLGNLGTTASNFLGTRDNQPLRIRTNNLQRMVIDTNGNVGIGTATPVAPLDVSGNVAIGGSVGIGTPINAGIKLNLETDASRTPLSVRGGGSAGVELLRIYDAGGTEAMRIDNLRNIGIGTSAPATRLHVSVEGATREVARFTANANPFISLFQNTTPVAYITQDSGHTIIENAQNGGLFFRNNASYNLNILSNGNVGIGITTPGAKLEVNGGIYVLGGNGDVDGNGTTNITDATAIGSWIGGTKVLTSAEYARADINGDGKVNRIDQNLVMKIAVGLLTIDEARNDYGKRMENIVGWDIFDGYSVTPNKIGIGVTNPSAKLDVNGDSLFRNNVTINGSLRVTSGGPLSGQVLTALDNLGNTAWRNPAETGVQFTTNTWINSKPDNVNRFFFMNGGRTSFGSQGGFLWKSPTDATIANLDTNGGFYTLGNHVMNNSSPTLYLQDTDNRSAMVHANSNLLYFLRGNGNNSTTWEPFNGYYPLVLNLENNDATFGGNIQVRSNGSIGGYLGIGTGTPEQNLEIYKDNADSTIRFHDPGDAWFSMGIDRSDSGKFKINYGGALGDSNHFTMTNGGNIGIGTNSPGAKLTILGGAADPLQLSDGTKSFRVGPSVGVVGGFQIYDDQAAAVRMRIDNSGNIGIGTTTPGAKLDVLSTAPEVAQFSSTTPNVFFSLFGAGEQKAIIASTGSSLYINNRAPGGSIFLGTALSTKAISIAPNGFVGFGVETPTTKVDIESGFRLRDGAEAGKVLTSDADGNASWQTINPSVSATNVTNNIPPGYIEKDWTLDEDVYGNFIFGNMADTCGSGNAEYTCGVSSNFSCIDKIVKTYSCFPDPNGYGQICPPTETGYRNVVCKKLKLLVKLQENCAAIPQCSGLGNCDVTIGTPSSVDQPFVVGAPSCGLTCKNGYSGASCEIPPCERVALSNIFNACGTANLYFNPVNPKNTQLYIMSRTYNEGTGRAFFCEPAVSNAAKDLWLTKYGQVQERKSAKPVPLNNSVFWSVSVYNGNSIGNYYLPAPGACSYSPPPDVGGGP